MRNSLRSATCAESKRKGPNHCPPVDSNMLNTLNDDTSEARVRKHYRKYCTLKERGEIYETDGVYLIIILSLLEITFKFFFKYYTIVFVYSHINKNITN